MNYIHGKIGIPRAVLLTLAAGVLVAIVTFGVVSGNAQGEGDDTVQEKLTDLRQQVKADPSRGYVSRGGNTGRVTVISDEGGDLSVDTPRGVVQVHIGDQTTIKQYGSDKVLTSDDLTLGKLVALGEGRTPSGEITVIEVVVEGEGGYQLSPVDLGTPGLVPVFP